MLAISSAKLSSRFGALALVIAIERMELDRADFLATLSTSGDRHGRP